MTLTSEQTYKQRYESIEQWLKIIKAQLASHKKRQEINSQNWGFAGDLAHVEELLTEISDFLPKADFKVK